MIFRLIQRNRERSGGVGSDPIADVALLLVDELDAMVAYWNAEKICVFANHAYKTWFGKGRADIIGLSMLQLLGPLYYQNLPYITAAFAGAKQVFERDIPVPGGEGTRPSLATYIPHFIDGEVCGIIVHVADVSPLKVLQRQLEEARLHAEYLAVHDHLTGLLNRRSLAAQLPTLLARAGERGEAVGIFCIDIDSFKGINDSLGHEAGDGLLIQIAQRLKQVCAPDALVVRLSGDEFLVLSRLVSGRREAEELAATLLRSACSVYVVAGVAVPCTISVGCALFPENGTSPEHLLAQADRALYDAKALGKSRYQMTLNAESP